MKYAYFIIPALLSISLLSGCTPKTQSGPAIETQPDTTTQNESVETEQTEVQKIESTKDIDTVVDDIDEDLDTLDTQEDFPELSDEDLGL